MMIRFGLLIFIFCLSSCSNSGILKIARSNSDKQIDALVAINNQNQSRIPAILIVKLEKVLVNRGYNCNGTSFSESYLKSNRFNLLINGDSREIKRLNLSKYVDFALLGCYKVVSFNSENGIITVQLEFSIIEATTSKIVESSVFTERAIGLTFEEAEILAIDKLVTRFK